ncbi:acyl-CoA synthetase FdrA [Brevibacillus borstelensis]|uniref:acyl-CoA synthetase FdrA n=1 Tax=Brevibacillus borstelensis TaxID=45462 RepID=UPI0030C53E4D
MLYTVIKSNSYQDSVSLMLLTNKLSEMEGINRISVMMGTPANKDIFKNTGLYTDELEAANPSDICIVIDTDSEEMIAQVVAEVDNFLKNQASKGQGSKFSTVRTWDSALKKLPDANLALISIPGKYAAQEARKAVEKGLHVFMFSDNVSIAEEREVKELAKEKGLLVMGPDCGTGIVSEVPLAFANVVSEGNIGIVGASGTGIQEVSTLIDHMGGGITHAIGTGGRDLSEGIGAITAIDSLKGLAADEKTKVIVLISKPPAPAVRDRVISVLKTFGKPVVAVFMGEKPAVAQEQNIHYAWTLEDTAKKAMELAQQAAAEAEAPAMPEIAGLDKIKASGTQQYIKGLYSGGTLAYEAAMLISDGLEGADESDHQDGVMLKLDGHEVIDLGDDAYTQGRAHPMIDPRLRVEMIVDAAKDSGTAVILLDVVIGYGAFGDPAQALVSAIEQAKEEAAKAGRGVLFIASVTGTAKDPQQYDEQVQKLNDVGVIIKESNASAVRLAIQIVKQLQGEKAPENQEASVSEAVKALLASKPKVVNIGLRHFSETILQYGGQVVQYDWAPAAGGNEKLAKLLALLK